MGGEGKAEIKVNIVSVGFFFDATRSNYIRVDIFHHRRPAKEIAGKNKTLINIYY